MRPINRELAGDPVSIQGFFNRKARIKRDYHHENENLLLKSLPRASTVAGFLLVCAVLFLPVWLDENYLSCITSEKGIFHNKRSSAKATAGAMSPFDLQDINMFLLTGKCYEGY